MMQKTTIIMTSIRRIKLESIKPEADIYCPIPAAIVAIAKRDEIKYNNTSKMEIFNPNTF
jgi:hypothetical protein